MGFFLKKKYSCKILEDIERERQKYLEMRKIYGGCISMKIEEMAGNSMQRMQVEGLVGNEIK